MQKLYRSGTKKVQIGKIREMIDDTADASTLVSRSLIQLKRHMHLLRCVDEVAHIICITPPNQPTPFCHTFTTNFSALMRIVATNAH